jgi:hypothetical protein
MSLVLGLGVMAVMAIGYTRAFEGSAVAIPVLAAIRGAILMKRAPLRALLPAATVILAGASCLLLYCRAVTGHALRPPYAVNQGTYGWLMVFPWFHPPEVQFRDIELRRYFDLRARRARPERLAGQGAGNLTVLFRPRPFDSLGDAASRVEEQAAAVIAGVRRTHGVGRAN